MLLDTNVYISFLNAGKHEDAVLGTGLARHMSMVALMELERGKRASSVHDVLIALTAKDLGAMVITDDVSDYAAIRELVDFSFGRA